MARYATSPVKAAASARAGRGAALLCVALLAAGLHRRSRLSAARGSDAREVAHRHRAGRRDRRHPLVGAVRRPGAGPADRRGAARQSRPRCRRGAGRPVHRRADDDPLAVLSADRLQRRRGSQPGEPGRLAADPGPRRSLHHAVPGRAERAVADRPVRPGAPAERGGAGAGVRERAGAPRRRAVGHDRRGGRLHRPARAGPAARDRARDGRQLRRDAEDLRPALQGRRGVAGRGRAGRVAVPAGARRHPGDRTADRSAGEPDQHPARPQPGADRARHGRSTNWSRRRFPATCPRPCSNGGRTSCRPSRTWSPRTRASVSRDRCITRRCR